MIVKFKYKQSAIVKHPINGDGIITDLRLNQHNMPAYWIEYKNTNCGHTEIEMDKHNIIAEANEHEVEVLYKCGQLVKDISLNIKGRVMCVNISTANKTLISVLTINGEMWVNEEHIMKANN